MDLFRTLVAPGVVSVFALVFAGEHVRDQVIDPPPSLMSRRSDELSMAPGSRLGIIDSLVGNLELQAALDARGYTPARAQRLDRIGVGERPSEYYFARFPIGFEAGELERHGRRVGGGSRIQRPPHRRRFQHAATGLPYACGPHQGPASRDTRRERGLSAADHCKGCLRGTGLAFDRTHGLVVEQQNV